MRVCALGPVSSYLPNGKSRFELAATVLSTCCRAKSGFGVRARGGVIMAQKQPAVIERPIRAEMTERSHGRPDSGTRLAPIRPSHPGTAFWCRTRLALNHRGHAGAPCSTYSQCAISDPGRPWCTTGHVLASRSEGRTPGCASSPLLDFDEAAAFAVLGPTSIDFALAVLAVLEAGGVAVLLNPLDPPSRTAMQIDLVEADFMLYDLACAAVAGACVGNRRAWSFEEFERPSRQRELIRRAPPAPTDAALVLFSSGTTGTPKAIVQSHYAVTQNAWSLVEHHRIQPGTRLLGVLPLHHVNGLEFTLLAAMLGGGPTPS